MTNRIKGLIVILIVGISSIMVFQLSFSCISKSITDIPCPACGLTRSFKLILKGNIIESLNYNIFALPLFILLIILVLTAIVQSITDKPLLINIYKYLDKYKMLIFVILIISWILNIVRNI